MIELIIGVIVGVVVGWNTTQPEFVSVLVDKVKTIIRNKVS